MTYRTTKFGASVPLTAELLRETQIAPERAEVTNQPRTFSLFVSMNLDAKLIEKYARVVRRVHEFTREALIEEGLCPQCFREYRADAHHLSCSCGWTEDLT